MMLHRREIVKRFTNITNIYGLQLRLITPDMELYHCREEALPKDLPKDPWWAFLWPGGRMMTRYILENPHVFENKRVFDLGSGCGSASIASLASGARYVVANDIDPFAEAALFENLDLNGIRNDGRVSFLIDNKIGAPNSFFEDFDIILCGDMLYDPEHAPTLLKNLKQHRMVIFGDPGRTYCPKHLEDGVLASYPILEDGFSHVNVFKLTLQILKRNNIEITD